MVDEVSTRLVFRTTGIVLLCVLALLVPGEGRHLLLPAERRELIYNGSPKAPEEYPFGVIICKMKSGSGSDEAPDEEIKCDSRCTGSLVSPGVVLTAAHCFMEYPEIYQYNNNFTGHEEFEKEFTSAYGVIFGASRSGPHTRTDTVGIEKIVIGEPFEVRKNSAAWDVALVFLAACEADMPTIQMLEGDLDLSQESEDNMAGAPSPKDEFGGGCYNLTSHRCECAVSGPQDHLSCEARGGLYMSQCDCAPPQRILSQPSEGHRIKLRDAEIPPEVSIIGWGNSHGGSCVGSAERPGQPDPLHGMAYRMVRCETDRMCRKNPRRCDEELVVCMAQEDTASCSGDSGGPVFVETQGESDERVEVRSSGAVGRFVQVAVLTGGEIHHLDGLHFRDHATGAFLPAYTEWLKTHLLTDRCLLDGDVNKLFAKHLD